MSRVIFKRKTTHKSEQEFYRSSEQQGGWDIPLSGSLPPSLWAMRVVFHPPWSEVVIINALVSVCQPPILRSWLAVSQSSPKSTLLFDYCSHLLRQWGRKLNRKLYRTSIINLDMTPYGALGVMHLIVGKTMMFYCINRDWGGSFWSL